MPTTVRELMHRLLDDDLLLDFNITCKQCGNRESVKIEEAIDKVETKKKEKKPSTK